MEYAESKRVAALLLTAPNDAAWVQAIEVENILQKKAPATARRLGALDATARKTTTERESEVAMDDAIALIEAAAAAAKPVHQVATPGDATKPLQTGQPNVPQPVAKTTRVIRAAELSTKTYLETEADVDAFVDKLKAELLAAVRSGQIARIQ